MLGIAPSADYRKFVISASARRTVGIFSDAKQAIAGRREYAE
jgi:hypothetical protein